MDDYLHFYSDLNSSSAFYIPPRFLLSLFLHWFHPFSYSMQLAKGSPFLYLATFIRYLHQSENTNITTIIIISFKICSLIDTITDSSSYQFRVPILQRPTLIAFTSILTFKSFFRTWKQYD